MRIPTVNLEDANALKSFTYACSHVGCFQIVDSVLERASEIGDIQRCFRRFFHLPLETKMKIRVNAKSNWRGYVPLGCETTRGKSDIKEGFYMGQNNDGNIPFLSGRNRFISGNDAVEGLAHAAALWCDANLSICRKISKLVASTLNLTNEEFSSKIMPEGPFWFCRAFWYPSNSSTSAEQSDMGIHKHTDMGLITVLMLDGIGALRVQGRDGKIYTAKSGVYLLVGDTLAALSSQELYAPLHWVDVPGNSESRLSLVFFFDPSWNAPVMDVTYGRYLVGRDFKWMDVCLESISKTMLTNDSRKRKSLAKIAN